MSGSVHDEETKTSILDALKAVFGAEKVEGDIAVDPNCAVAPWLSDFPSALESLKTRGVQVVFDEAWSRWAAPSETQNAIR